MNLDPAQVRLTVRFLEAYANTALDELDEILGPEYRQTNSPQLGINRWPLMDEPAFTIAADAASALREAGQWMLYLNISEARAFLARSGLLFHELRQPFGAYLIAVSGQEWSERLNRHVASAVTSIGRPNEGGESEGFSLQHPQQQAYLVLAAASAPDIVFGSQLQETLDKSIYRDGVAAIGALATPIRRFWSIARHLISSIDGAVLVIAEHLAFMCRHYAESMELGQVNASLWEHGAAPVDIGDIDIIGISAMTARRFSGEVLLSALRQYGISVEQQSIAITPVEIGLAIVEPWRDEPLRGDG